MGEFGATLRERVLDARLEVGPAWRVGDLLTVDRQRGVGVHGWADAEIVASVIEENG
ncbi:hypothetical protein [Kutzneria sp. CA-103260]|uniref:hypothetical protein n=1 Tax=Kutzneria sp. CA-103260 TaxID=2802641 RepID=UPI001BA7A299|nr:hypothetical protein [Kutzneria sp. CA-103260]QUQ64226.1 hypothetical protein JJ691_19460 [Kutzneria sp. CA-103260]